MGEEVERELDGSVPVGITVLVDGSTRGPTLQTTATLPWGPEIVQPSQARMKSKFDTDTGDHAGSQEAGLRYRQSTRVPASGHIRRVVVIGNDHITTVVAAVQKNANQGPIIGRLSQRVGADRSAQRPTLQRQTHPRTGIEILCVWLPLMVSFSLSAVPDTATR